MILVFFAKTIALLITPSEKKQKKIEIALIIAAAVILAASEIVDKAIAK